MVGDARNIIRVGCLTRLLTCILQGAIQNNQSLIEEGYNQISAYYDILHDNGVGMMKHILLGDPGVQDHNHWATGNGWAVNGMLRVLRIIQLSNIASNLGTEQAILIQRVSTVSPAASLRCLPVLYLIMGVCYSLDSVKRVESSATKRGRLELHHHEPFGHI